MLLASAVLASMTTLASAQESLIEDQAPAPSSFQVPAAFHMDTEMTDPDDEEEGAAEFVDLPLSLFSEPMRVAGEPSFSIGPEGGYLRARGSERGTWFAGAKARLHLLQILAAEASITFHENRYQHSQVIVSQYPVQLTAFLYLISEGPIRPYILGG